MKKEILSEEECKNSEYYQAGYYCGFCVGLRGCYRSLPDGPDRKQAYIVKTHKLLGIQLQTCLVSGRMKQADIDKYFMGYDRGRVAHGSGAWVYESQQNAQALYNLDHQLIRMPYTLPIGLIEDFQDACAYNHDLPKFVLEDLLREYIEKNRLE